MTPIPGSEWHDGNVYDEAQAAEYDEAQVDRVAKAIYGPMCGLTDAYRDRARKVIDAMAEPPKWPTNESVAAMGAHLYSGPTAALKAGLEVDPIVKAAVELAKALRYWEGSSPSVARVCTSRQTARVCTAVEDAGLLGDH
jgi:hypothetical protein